jgi:hypothetical protein
MEAAKEVIQCGQYLVTALEDGHIDRSDLSAFDNFLEVSGAAQTRLEYSRAAVHAERERIAS